jgi:hypothetical protein
MQTNYPDKHKVREVTQRHWAKRTPPPSPADYRRELGWGLVQGERLAQRTSRA